MSGIFVIILIVFGFITIIVLGCVWMGTSYSEKKRGLRSGASEREIHALQQQVTQIRDETEELKKQVQELINIAKGITQ